MNNFSAEIFDPGLLQQVGGRNSHGQRVSEMSGPVSCSGSSGSGSISINDLSIPLKPTHSKRIFHMGDSTPSGSEDDQFIIGKSKSCSAGYGSGSESDYLSDGDDGSGSNPLARSGSIKEGQGQSQGRLSRKSSFSEVMDQFRNATKSLGRDHSRKKPHGIFSQPPEESSDYESEDNNEQYKEYVGKSKVGKSKSSVSLLKDFLHFNSSHSISKSLKSKQGSQGSVNQATLSVNQAKVSNQQAPNSLNQSQIMNQVARNSSTQARISSTSTLSRISAIESYVVASPISVPHLSPDHLDDAGHHSGMSNQSTLERHHSPGDSSVCSTSPTPPLHPISFPPLSTSVSSKFKDLLLPPASMSSRRSSIGSHKSTNSNDDLQGSSSHPPSRSSSELNLNSKYGNLSNVLGKGAFATVKLCCPVGSKEKYAVKEFRKKKKEESTKEYIKKVQAEFCIASSMDNENIVKCVDLIQDSKGAWCVVMDFCKDGDLFARISNNSLTNEAEQSCYFSQLVHGVKYLHSIGVAHRDLKPENILLQGNILKITDFGVSTVFKNPFGAKREKQRGITGSGPYIAPEEWTDGEYDSELVDVWAIGIIGYVMTSNSIPWRCAQLTDTRFRLYTESNKKFSPFERIHPGLRKLIYKILEPDPTIRLGMEGLIADEWLSSVEVCTSATIDRMMHIHSSHNK